MNKDTVANRPRPGIAGALAIALGAVTLALWIPGAMLTSMWAPALVANEPSSETLWHLKMAGLLIGGAGLVLLSFAVTLAVVLRGRFPRWFRIILVLLPGLGVLVGAAFYVGAYVKHAFL